MSKTRPSQAEQYDPRLTARLTRYLSLGAYIDFLSKGLFLSRVTAFEDPWEGHVFHSLNAKPTTNREALARAVNSSKRWIYASCWHAADHESYAMWRIYGRDAGVAIHSDYSRISSLMEHIRIGDRTPFSLLTTVHYAEPKDGRLPDYKEEVIYSTSFGPQGGPEPDPWKLVMQHCLALKPLAYEYEKEVRLLVLDPTAPPFWEQMVPSDTSPGIRVSLNPSTFLTGVAVSPWAPSWFVDSVKLATARLGFADVPVEQSPLYSAPKGDPFGGVPKEPKTPPSK